MDTQQSRGACRSLKYRTHTSPTVLTASSPPGPVPPHDPQTILTPHYPSIEAPRTRRFSTSSSRPYPPAAPADRIGLQGTPFLAHQGLTVVSIHFLWCQHRTSCKAASTQAERLGTNSSDTSNYNLALITLASSWDGLRQRGVRGDRRAACHGIRQPERGGRS